MKTISTTLIQKYFISVLDIANMEDVQSDQSEDDTLPNLPDRDNPDEATVIPWPITNTFISK